MAFFPTQTRAVDPYSELHSSNINKLSRILTRGNSVIMKNRDFTVTRNSSTTLLVTPGECIIDDMHISISSTYAINIRMTNTLYLNNIIPTAVGTYYFAIYYMYSKSRPAPKAGYVLLNPSELSNISSKNYLFLAKVNIINSGGIAISSVENYDNLNVNAIRKYADVFAGIYPTTPTFNVNEHEGMLIYTDDENEVLLGRTTQWERLNPTTELMNTTSCVVGDLFYIDGSGNAQKASASSLNTYANGVVTSVGTVAAKTGVVSFLGKHRIKITGGASIGQKLYLSTTAGMATTTPPTNIQYIGIAVSVASGGFVDAIVYSPFTSSTAAIESNLSALVTYSGASLGDTTPTFSPNYITGNENLTDAISELNRDIFTNSTPSSFSKNRNGLINRGKSFICTDHYPMEMISDGRFLWTITNGNEIKYIDTFTDAGDNLYFQEPNGRRIHSLQVINENIYFVSESSDGTSSNLSRIYKYDLSNRIDSLQYTQASADGKIDKILFLDGYLYSFHTKVVGSVVDTKVIRRTISLDKDIESITHSSVLIPDSSKAEIISVVGIPKKTNQLNDENEGTIVYLYRNSPNDEENNMFEYFIRVLYVTYDAINAVSVFFNQINSPTDQLFYEIETDGEYLYLKSNNKIIKLTTNLRQVEKVVFDENGGYKSSNVSKINYDGNYLYSISSGHKDRITKICPHTLNVLETIHFSLNGDDTFVYTPTCICSDDVYLYIGCYNIESATDIKVFKVKVNENKERFNSLERNESVSLDYFYSQGTNLTTREYKVLSDGTTLTSYPNNKMLSDGIDMFFLQKTASASPPRYYMCRVNLKKWIEYTNTYHTDGRDSNLFEIDTLAPKDYLISKTAFRTTEMVVRDIIMCGNYINVLFSNGRLDIISKKTLGLVTSQLLTISGNSRMVSANGNHYICYFDTNSGLYNIRSYPIGWVFSTQQWSFSTVTMSHFYDIHPTYHKNIFVIAYANDTGVPKIGFIYLNPNGTATIFNTIDINVTVISNSQAKLCISGNNVFFKNASRVVLFRMSNLGGSSTLNQLTALIGITQVGTEVLRENYNDLGDRMVPLPGGRCLISRNLQTTTNQAASTIELLHTIDGNLNIDMIHIGWDFITRVVISSVGFDGKFIRIADNGNFWYALPIEALPTNT